MIFQLPQLTWFKNAEICLLMILRSKCHGLCLFPPQLLGGRDDPVGLFWPQTVQAHSPSSPTPGHPDTQGFTKAGLQHSSPAMTFQCWNYNCMSPHPAYVFSLWPCWGEPKTLHILARQASFMKLHPKPSFPSLIRTLNTQCLHLINP